MGHVVHFQPSRILSCLLVGMHLLAAVSLVSIELPLWSKLALGLVLVLNLTVQLRDQAMLTAATSCIGLAMAEDGVEILTRDNGRLQCSILRSTTVTPFLTVINLLPLDGRFSRSVIVVPDKTDAESFRQLRVWLKWQA